MKLMGCQVRRMSHILASMATFGKRGPECGDYADEPIA